MLQDPFIVFAGPQGLHIRGVWDELEDHEYIRIVECYGVFFAACLARFRRLAIQQDVIVVGQIVKAAHFVVAQIRRNQ